MGIDIETVIQLQNIISTEKFAEDIKLISEEMKIEFIEAVLEYCQRNNIEVETAAEIIKKNNELKSIIHGEAKKLHQLK